MPLHPLHRFWLLDLVSVNGGRFLWLMLSRAFQTKYEKIRYMASIARWYFLPTAGRAWRVAGREWATGRRKRCERAREKRRQLQKITLTVGTIMWVSPAKRQKSGHPRLVHHFYVGVMKIFGLVALPFEVFGSWKRREFMRQSCSNGPLDTRNWISAGLGGKA